MLADTVSSLFVTTFYAVLDPASHTLVYVNGGHNPPYLLNQAGDLTELTRTRIPLEEGEWQQKSTTLNPGDVLCLYTDGVTEADGEDGVQFEEERLLAVMQQHHTAGAQAVHAGLKEAIQAFTAGIPQSDDVTMIVLQRAA